MSASIHFLRRSARRYALNEYGGSSLDAVTNSWYSRVQTNGGAAPSSATVAAIDTFVKAVRSAGIFSSLLEVNCFAPDSLTACQTPLIVTTGNDPWTNHSFVAGDLSTAGLKGDGSTKYLDTGFIPTVGFVSNYSAGLSLYVPAATGYALAGSSDSPFTHAYNLQNLNSGNSYWECWTYTAPSAVIVAAAVIPGFICGSRTAQNASALYKGSSTGGFATAGTTSTNIASTAPAYSLFTHVINNGGAPLYNGTQTLSFTAAHTGLTSTQAQALYNAVQAMRVSLGGGYV